MGQPKALLIHADGTVETLSANEACGAYLIRYPKCKECGQETGGPRVYQGHFAKNANTRVNQKLLDGAKGPPNDGTLVYIETLKI